MKCSGVDGQAAIQQQVAEVRIAEPPVEPTGLLLPAGQTIREAGGRR